MFRFAECREGLAARKRRPTTGFLSQNEKLERCLRVSLDEFRASLDSPYIRAKSAFVHDAILRKIKHTAGKKEPSFLWKENFESEEASLSVELLPLEREASPSVELFAKRQLYFKSSSSKDSKGLRQSGSAVFGKRGLHSLFSRRRTTL